MTRRPAALLQKQSQFFTKICLHTNSRATCFQTPALSICIAKICDVLKLAQHPRVTGREKTNQPIKNISPLAVSLISVDDVQGVIIAANLIIFVII